MIVARTRAELALGLGSLRAGGRTVGFVPTMGYLHEGHLSLVDLARSRSDAVVASIYVNPLQFGPGEDLASYPRDAERDLRMLEARKTDLVFLPADQEMYPDGPPTVTVDPGRAGTVLCGAYRPVHFRGVLTVVAKLFGLFRPDVAVFGRKDFQQLVLIQRMARDLDMPIDIVGGAIVRERDGLARSSRNAYLSGEERSAAPELQRGLAEARERFRAGERSAGALLDAVRAAVGRSPLLRLQYAEVVDARTLEPVDPVPDGGAVLALAAFCGKTRLIDNVALEESA